MIHFCISSLFFSSNIAIKKLINNRRVLKAWPSINESSNNISETTETNVLKVNKLILFLMEFALPFVIISFLFP